MPALVDEIITLLSSEVGSITDALLKTKILLHQVGHKELTAWVNDELNGYDHEKELPPYRKLETEVRANIATMTFRATSHPIPILHLTDEQRESITNIDARESLASIVRMAKSDNLRRNIPMENNIVLGKGLAAHTHIEQAWCEISPLQMQNIVIQVRSRLLDFMLELKTTLGTAETEEAVKEKASTVDLPALLEKAITGQNNTIIFGGYNQTVTNNVVQGNFFSLAERLRELGVDKKAVEDLKQKVEHEESEPKLKQRVTQWLTTQAEKQLAAGIDAGAKAAMSTSIDAVAHAVRTYLGW